MAEQPPPIVQPLMRRKAAEALIAASMGESTWNDYIDRHQPFAFTDRLEALAALRAAVEGPEGYFRLDKPEDEPVTFESVQFLKPEPDEVIVVTLSGETAAKTEALYAATVQLAGLFPDNKLMIVETGDTVTAESIDGAITFLEGLRDG